MKGKLRVLAGLYGLIACLGGAVIPADAVGRGNPAQSLSAIAERWNRPPVDARVDRVWHAIPGLYGWRLDVPASLAATERQRDGNLHMVWRKVAPRVRLSDLPAEPIYRGPSQEKSACLMFNVSWGEEYMPTILKALAAAGVKATFFLDGRWVERHPQLAKQIAAAGMDIGSHGSGHPDFRKLTMAQLARQIDGSRHAIAEATGVTPDLLAPPAGSYDQRVVRLAANRRTYTILWTVDTIDWRRPPASAIERRAIQLAEPGMLLLMHPTAPTAQALPRLIASLKEHGYSFKTVDQVVHEQPATVPPGLLR
jgi:probable sporulation protein (polysaccharide deacetylase family)